MNKLNLYGPIASHKILYGPGKNDEMMTPRYAVRPIIKYLPKDKIIWCPFDHRSSWFVVLLEGAGFQVIHSHKDRGYHHSQKLTSFELVVIEGKNFYDYEPEHWDIMISNPPFTNKRKIFERALSFGKPFALLMSLTWLNDSAPKQLFKDKDLQLLMFDKRIHYQQPNGTVCKKTTFSSAYYCWNVLPKQIIMEEL